MKVEYWESLITTPGFEGQLWFKVVKQTALGSGWDSGPNGSHVGAVGCTEASCSGCCDVESIVACSFKWSSTFLNLPSLSTQSVSIGPRPVGQETAGLYQVPLASGSRHYETCNPRPVFHSISSIITYDTCLLTCSTEARAYVNVQVCTWI